MILPSFQRFHIQLKSGKLSNQNLIRSYPIHCSACLHMYIMHLHITAYIILYTNANTSLSLSLSLRHAHISSYIYIYIYVILYNKVYIYIIMVIHGSIFTILDVLNQPWLREPMLLWVSQQELQGFWPGGCLAQGLHPQTPQHRAVLHGTYGAPGKGPRLHQLR